MNPIATSLLALSLLATATTARAQDCTALFARGQPPVLLRSQPQLRTTMLCNDAYAALASGLTHGPLWSAEHPTTDSLQAARAMPRQSRFHPDDRLPFSDQAQLDDYRGSGYDRGHMTPNGSMPTDKAQQQSFALSNIVPQTAQLNRGVWEGIEAATRRLAEREGELYIVTGPSFQGATVHVVGMNLVFVPTSTWKAVFSPAMQTAGVYTCTNTDEPKCRVEAVSDLMAETGIDPFPALPEATKARAMRLPAPEDSPYAPRRHGEGSSDALQQLRRLFQP